MASSEKRQDSRLPVLWTGTVTTDDDRSFPCDVRDVSHAGTLISCDEDFKMGERLLLEIEGLGEFAVEIKWKGSDQLGLMILAGPDLVLKKFTEGAGSDISKEPSGISGDPLAN